MFRRKQKPKKQKIKFPKGTRRKDKIRMTKRLSELNDGKILKVDDGEDNVKYLKSLEEKNEC